MDLFIIRHAQATYHLEEGSDRERPLTEAGVLQAVRLAKLFQKKGLAPTLLLSSPYKRARETAQILSEYSHTSEVQCVEWLGCGMLPQTATDALQPFSLEHQKIAIVGHQPDLSMLIEYLDQHAHLASVPVSSLHYFKGTLQKAGGAVQRLSI